MKEIPVDHASLSFAPAPVKITVQTTRAKHVSIKMSRSTDRLDLDPDEAMALADVIIRHAREAKILVFG